jgi:hypothetical protein
MVFIVTFINFTEIWRLSDLFGGRGNDRADITNWLVKLPGGVWKPNYLQRPPQRDQMSAVFRCMTLKSTSLTARPPKSNILIDNDVERVSLLFFYYYGKRSTILITRPPRSNIYWKWRNEREINFIYVSL